FPGLSCKTPWIWLPRCGGRQTPASVGLRGSLMRLLYCLGLFPLLLGCAPAGGLSHGAQALAADGVDAPNDLVPGKTQPAPGHVAIIAPAVLHPVTDVLVQIGDHVKKGQALVKLDADEPEADVRG